MRVISLFAGIEGFGLAAHQLGWEVVASVEWEEFPQMVIKKRFPNTELYGDIRKFNGTKYRGAIDIVCGGFPCQPFSVAGQQKGVDDHRYLWPEMLRTIREVQPTWVVGENVAGIINMGIPTGESRMESDEFTVKEEILVMQQIWQDLEDLGYQVQPFVIPAVAVNAPHRRDRIWIVAHSKHNGLSSPKIRYSNTEGNYNNETREKAIEQLERCNFSGNFANSYKFRYKRHKRFKQNVTKDRKRRTSIYGATPQLHNGNYWENFPTQSPICDGDDGISSRLVRYLLRSGGDVYTEEEAEKEAQRIISYVRKNAIKAGGNAIVHQVVMEIFKAINEFEKSMH